MGPKQGVSLLMPRLGEAVEPTHEHRLSAWWRTADHARAGKQSTGHCHDDRPEDDALATGLALE